MTRRLAFAALMATIMGVAVLSNSVLGVLSVFLIDDLEINVSQIGWVAATMSVTAAILSPSAGRVADRVGGRRMTLGVLVASGAGYVGMALSPVYGVLLVAALVAGLAQAAANPATNKLIVAHVREGRRGLVTGVKQSGVQMGLFVAGLTLPTLALAFGWRIALGSMVLIPLLGAGATLLIVPADHLEFDLGGFRRGGRSSPPRWVHKVSQQGVLVGICVGSLVTYLPLYAQAELGFSVVTAGTLAAAYGIAGLTARLVFSPLGERSRHLAVPMLVLTGIALTGAILLWIAPLFGTALSWVGSVMVGMLLGWNALGMLSVVTRIEQAGAGVASGLVARGFGIGTALGPLGFGFALQWTGGYAVGFAMIVLAIAGAAVLMYLWLRSETAR